MVFDYLIFGTALGFSIVASAYDLKTTEVPNWVFYAMMIIGIPAVILKFILGGDFSTFAISGMTGIGLLAFGYMMYRIGQWGGADMVLLALIGFMMPSVNLGFPAETTFPFGVSFLFNVFVIGAGYMIVYAIIFSLINGTLLPKFKQDIKGSWRFMSLVIVSIAVGLTAVMLYLNSIIGNVFSSLEMVQTILISTAVLAAFIFVYKFARLVENSGFKKRIPISKLKVGDMLVSETKLVGITKQQIAKMKRSGVKSVWIKEGVRFIPAFPLAILFTLYYGDAIMLAASLI
jgi:Flp pilus assembly protein protease CpaA